MDTPIIAEVICRKCGATVPPEQIKYVKHPYGTYPDKICRPCRSLTHRERYIAAGKVKKPHSAYRPYFDAQAQQQVKKCTRCETVRPVEDYGLLSKKADGLQPVCKPCRRIADAARPKRKRDPKQLRERSRAWVQKNKERRREICRRYYNNLSLEERSKRRKAASPYLKDYKARLRAQRNNAPAVDEVCREDIIIRDKSTCYLCGRTLTRDAIVLDHVVPLSRGGSHTADNLRVACGACNSRKYNKLLSELDWYHSTNDQAQLGG